MVFHERPKNIPKFLSDQLKLLKTARTAKKAHPYYTDADLKTLFQQMDTLETGSISMAQYQIAMFNIGVDDISDYMPPADSLDVKTFTTLATRALFDKLSN